ncbi:MAG TPA: hypothetical protein VKT76_17235 [Bradyrhizobium sp.]|nr:hypothetical protein [Bradyrhizobium sp.]
MAIPRRKTMKHGKPVVVVENELWQRQRSDGVAGGFIFDRLNGAFSVHIYRHAPQLKLDAYL